MKTVILCGGFGTRIRDVAEDVPKPMIQVGGKPILLHLMNYYAKFGHSEFVLCLGYKGSTIKNFFLNFEANTQDVTITMGSNPIIEYHATAQQPEWKVTLADTGSEAMTGARVNKIRKYVDGERFMLTYGDGLSNVNLNKLNRFHVQHKKTLTMTGVRPPGRFGELQSDQNGLVTEFNEKPQATGGRISGGFFVCEPTIFDVLNERDDLVFEQEPMRALVAKRELAVYEHDAFWQCMDTSRDWQLLNKMASDKSAPWLT